MLEWAKVIGAIIGWFILAPFGVALVLGFLFKCWGLH